MEHLQYPVGRFDPAVQIPHAERAALIDVIEQLPAQLRAAVASLSDAQLDTPYRKDGWTVRQVVHHVPDSHLNAYVRFKLALTEERPLIKTYEEARWAELPDSRTPIENSLALLDALHHRWVYLLRTLNEADYARELRHPEWGEISLGQMLRLYEWHCRHHLAHVNLVAQPDPFASELSPGPSLS